MIRWFLKILGVLGVGLLFSGLAALGTMKLLTTRGQFLVPDVRGRSIDEATRLAESNHLRIKVREPGVYNANIPASHVVSQEPLPGVPVKAGRTLEVTLSLGNEQIQVPSLEGDGVRSAQLKLKKIGLDIGAIMYVQHADLPTGVFLQEPAPGTSLLQGQSVVLIVNQAQDDVRIMPDLVGRPAEDVIAFFKRYGYRIGQVIYDTYVGIAPGIILRHTPDAGSVLSRQDIINLVVSRTP